MNYESRLRKLEEKAGSGECTCSRPLVVWPDQTDQDPTCPKCGRERVILKVEYHEGLREKERLI